VCVIDEAGEVLCQRDCPSRAADVERALNEFKRSRFVGVILEAGTGAHVARNASKPTIWKFSAHP